MKKPTKKELARLAAAAALGAAVTAAGMSIPPKKIMPTSSNQPVGWQSKYDALHK